MKNHIPIYVISLSSAPERRLHIKRQLDSFGLKYQLVDVDFIDKYKLESRTYRSWLAEQLEIDASTLENKYAMIGSISGKAKGQLAIILSHIKTYDLMIKHNHSEVCILEDDVTLLPTFPKILKIAPDLSWDILQLAHQSKPGVVWDLLNSCLYRRGQFRNKRVEFMLPILQCWLRNHHNVDQQVLKLYGFDARLHPEQAKYITKTIQEYRHQYRCAKEAISRFIMKAIGQSTQGIVMARDDYGALLTHTGIRLGALPKKTALNIITNSHCIAAPCGMLIICYSLYSKTGRGSQVETKSAFCKRFGDRSGAVAITPK